MNTDCILVATGNPNKQRELQTVGARFSLQLLSPSEIAEECGERPAVSETGASYRENAELKARAFCEWSGRPALGDDSGLEVTALNGEPGLFSARYVSEDAGYSERMQYIMDALERMESEHGTVDRSAVYKCSLALAFPDGAMMYADAALEGEVLRAPRGEGGFGYDPIILLHSLDKTLAEVDFSVTCSKGFRALAAERLFQELVAK